MRKAVVAITLAGIASSIVASLPTEAHAQTVHAISPDGKGIVGCGLLGAETVAIIEAAAGVRARWPYLVFPLLGAAGGAAGGYFLEQAANGGADTTLTGLSVASLVLGLGLAIPTTVAYVNATNYHPENDQPSEDNAPATGPLEESGSDNAPSAPANGPAPAGNTPAAGTTSSVHPARPASTTLAHRALTVPPSLFSVSREGLTMGVPAIAVGNAYSLAEVRQYNLHPVSELRVPLLSATF